MPDQKKRRTLKVMGAIPLAGVAAGVAGTATASLASMADFSSSSVLPKPVSRTGSMQLDIQIIDTSAVVNNHLLVRNTTDEALTVTRFMPGHIVFNNKFLDLQQLINSKPLVLMPGQSKSFDYNIQPIEKMSNIEYVWAEHAISALSIETNVVYLGAFMADTNAVIYADTREIVPS